MAPRHRDRQVPVPRGHRAWSMRDPYWPRGADDGPLRRRLVGSNLSDVAGQLAIDPAREVRPHDGHVGDRVVPEMEPRVIEEGKDRARPDGEDTADGIVVIEREKLDELDNVLELVPALKHDGERQE